MKKHFKRILNKIDKQKIIRNAIILIFTLSVFIGIDQFTKIYAFAQSGQSWIGDGVSRPQISEGKLFGIRLVINTGMFSSLGAGTVPYWGVQTITSLIAIAVIIAALFSSSKIVVFGLSLIASGALGNIMDRYMLIEPNGGHYVRDWIYNPFYDKGTYNIADIEVVFGSPIAAIGLIINTFKETKKEDVKDNKAKKKNFKSFKKTQVASKETDLKEEK
ncbi:signal peptidase II [Mycoplasma todarodis]|uniref:signal peptidase II n=1 Tax=Mycoplasma todarodis TaxID=1937191 RepID=UPI003B2C4BF0